MRACIGVITIATLAALACGRGWEAPAAKGPGDEGLTLALEAISPRLVKAHVRYLSHDLLRGRDTGDVGFELAREYVIAQLARLGLEPIDGASYLQTIDLLEAGADHGSELEVSGRTLRDPQARFTPAWLTGHDAWTGDGVYVGYGLTTHGRDDYGDTNVTGKAVFLLSAAPADWNNDRERARAAAARVEIALRREAAVVIELSPDVPVPQIASPTAAPRRTIVLADGTSTRPQPAARIFGESAASLAARWDARPTSSGPAGRPVGTVRLTRRHDVKRLASWNIVGVLRGSDPAKRDESVVFSAHLDHMGVCAPGAADSICNGTHDNAIGVAKTLAAAESLVRLRPPRSVVFAIVGAEERGELGSWYFVRHPVLPIEKMVAAINQDGGREGAVTEDVIDNAADVSNLRDIIKAVMDPLGVGVIDDRSPAAVVGFSSDHYPFLLAGVPAVDLKDGYKVNGDSERGFRERTVYYNTVRHKPADNFDEAFSFESAAEMARRSVRLAWHLANMAGRPEMRTDHVMWRKRGVPERPDYFGPRARF